MKKIMLSAVLGAMLVSNTIIASARPIKTNSEGSKATICTTSTDNPKNSGGIILFTDDPAGW